MASNSQSLLVSEAAPPEARRPFLQRLALERRKPLLLKLSALASLVMLVFAGLTNLPPSVLAGLVFLAADLQWLTLRVRLETPASVSDAEHEEAVMALQAQVEATRNEGPAGLHQRWYMEWRLRQECARCRRYGLSLAVIAVKVIGPEGVPQSEWLPDAYRAAQTMSTTIRNADLAAEIGPALYAVSLVHCDQVAAVAAMGRLAYELKGFDLEMGYVVFPDDDVPAGEIVDLAIGRLEPWGEDSQAEFNDEAAA
jgi:hypothetical protein